MIVRREVPYRSEIGEVSRFVLTAKGAIGHRSQKILVHYHVEKDCLETMLKKRHTNLHEPGVASAAIATEAHTLLRMAQLKRPFKRSTPRWPTAMTLELKRIFKANERAVALLRHFDYSGTHEW